MPKTKQQYEQIKLERERSIIKAALPIFAKNGYGPVTVDDITKAANCSHGLFYHYFKDKEDVFHKMMDYYTSILKEKIENVINIDQPAKNVLKDLLDAILNLLKSKNSEYVCALYLCLNIYLEREIIPKPPSTPCSGFKPLFILIKELIKKGQDEGDFYLGESSEYAIAIKTMLRGLAFSRLGLGYKRFTCPSSDIIMHLVMKNERR